MKNKKACIILVGIFFIMFLGLNDVSAQKKILLYEIQAKSQYGTDTAYSKFYKLVERTGDYSVTAMTREPGTKLSYSLLEKYDVVMLQNIRTPLTSDEIFSLTQYVSNGGGLFINGGDGVGVNMITMIFGIAFDEGGLFDDKAEFCPKSDPLNGIEIKACTCPKGKGDFKVNIANPKAHFLTYGVHNLVYYAPTNPKYCTLSPSGAACTRALRIDPSKARDVMILASTGENAQTDTAMIKKGDKPPIAASTFFGKGSVVVVSNVELFSDRYIFASCVYNVTTGGTGGVKSEQSTISFQNDQFLYNIIEWLSNKNAPLPPDATLEKCSQDLKGKIILLDKAEKQNDIFEGNLNDSKIQIQNLSAEISVLKARKCTANTTSIQYPSPEECPKTPLDLDPMIFGIICLVLGALIAFIFLKGSKKKKEEDRVEKLKPKRRVAKESPEAEESEGGKENNRER